MYTKEIRAQFKEELSHPGSFSSLRFDPLKHGANPKSFRSTVVYAAMSLGMKIRTEFDGDELVCQRVDVPASDSGITEFTARIKTDMDKAVELIHLLHPMPGDEHYELKSALVRIAELSIMQHGYQVQLNLKNLMETNHED